MNKDINPIKLGVIDTEWVQQAIHYLQDQLLKEHLIIQKKSPCIVERLAYCIVELGYINVMDNNILSFSNVLGLAFKHLYDQLRENTIDIKRSDKDSMIHIAYCIVDICCNYMFAEGLCKIMTSILDQYSLIELCDGIDEETL